MGIESRPVTDLTVAGLIADAGGDTRAASDLGRVPGDVRVPRRPGRPESEGHSEPTGNEWDAMSWRGESVCREHPTDWWFGGGPRESLRAKAICAGCGVQSECLEFALARPELLGLWAATTPATRANLRRQRRGESVPPVPTRARRITIAPVEPVAERAVDPGPVESGPVAVRPRPVLVPVGPPPAAPPKPAALGIVHEPDELLTPAEAARKLGVTPNTVTRWSRGGKIAAIQTMGGHRRFRRAEIERLLREGSETERAAPAS